ncbi:MAG: hypothetical protein V2B18_03195, partial [Pseudomonadota bacterium]
MTFAHNEFSFMTGDEAFLPVEIMEGGTNRVEGRINYESRHEGLIGIPHGGLSMGFCIDYWRRMANVEYPVNVNFRFGGSGVAIGESADFKVESVVEGPAPGVKASITKDGDKTPYLRAEITHTDEWAPTLPESAPPDY